MSGRILFSVVSLLLFFGSPYCRNRIDIQAEESLSEHSAILGGSVPLTIAALPATKTVVVGEIPRLAISVYGGISPLSFEWRQNGAVLAGSTTETLTLPAAILAHGGRQYSVTVRDAAGKTLTSNIAVLSVVSAPTFASLLSTIRDFAETGARNWSYGGHVIDFAQFTEERGFWDYTDTTFEPWLYDRPYVWRILSVMTGEARWQAQSDADLAYYASRLGPDGLFINKGDDAKYSYVHEWSSDTVKALAAYNATLAAVPNVADLAGPALWTERQMWFALDAAVKYHTLSGNPAALTRAQAIVDQWDQVCAGRGAPLVSYTKHEGGGPGGTLPTDLITSPWMAALYFQSARLYALKVPAAQAQIDRQASDYFDWMNVPANRGFYPGTDVNPGLAHLWLPGYMAGGTLIGDARPAAEHMDHALDVSGLLAFVLKSKQRLGLPTHDVETRLAQMKITAAAAFNDATRLTSFLPRYRLTPPRKLMWWIRGIYELYANGG